MKNEQLTVQWLANTVSELRSELSELAQSINSTAELQQQQILATDISILQNDLVTLRHDLESFKAEFVKAGAKMTSMSQDIETHRKLNGNTAVLAANLTEKVRECNPFSSVRPSDFVGAKTYADYLTQYNKKSKSVFYNEKDSSISYIPDVFFSGYRRGIGVGLSALKSWNTLVAVPATCYLLRDLGATLRYSTLVSLRLLSYVKLSIEEDDPVVSSLHNIFAGCVIKTDLIYEN